jgi:hypothetical protein
MQNAALEHALLSPTGDSEYVAFAGALEQARTERQPSISGVTMLACLVSLQLDRRSARPHDCFAEIQTTSDLLVEGALVALDRFDLSPTDAASLANRSVDDFETELERRS